jgi:hypothetical protein
MHFTSAANIMILHNMLPLVIGCLPPAI